MRPSVDGWMEKGEPSPLCDSTHTQDEQLELYSLLEGVRTEADVSVLSTPLPPLILYVDVG